MEGLKSLTRHFSLMDIYEDEQEDYNCDFDLLEAGGARETFSDVHLNPLSLKLRKLYKTHIIREDKTKFYMYDETTNSFLLSAKMVGTTFYISLYERFPNTFQDESTKNSVGTGASYVGVVRLNKAKAYTLYSKCCEHCDLVAGFLTCGLSHSGERQELGVFRHGSQPVSAGYDSVIECNVVSVKLPTVYSDMSRDVICPRSNSGRMNLRSKSADKTNNSDNTTDDRYEEEEKHTDYGYNKNNQRMMMNNKQQHIIPGHGKRQMLHRAQSAPVNRISDHNENAKVLAGAHTGLGCALKTRVPRFDKNTGSLRMKFLNNRVRMASSKNLIFCLDKDSDHIEPSTMATDNKMLQDEERVVLQFGKYSDERYSLDFKFPLAPIQAFALALTLFNWQGANQ